MRAESCFQLQCVLKWRCGPPWTLDGRWVLVCEAHGIALDDGHDDLDAAIFDAGPLTKGVGMNQLRNPTPDARVPLTDEVVRARRLRGWLPDYGAWSDTKARMPMLRHEADQILEADSEMRGEFGMGYVCGGGSSGDANLAYAMGQTDRERDVVAQAQATLDLLYREWYVREFFPPGHDFGADVPF